MAKDKDQQQQQKDQPAETKAAAPEPTKDIAPKTDQQQQAPAVDKVPPGVLGAQALPPITDMTNPTAPERGEFRPRQDVHLAQAGRVALENWVGRVNGRRVRVYRGAPADQIPADVQKAMAASGCQVGELTYEDLGLRAPSTEPRGARVVGVEKG